MIVGRPRFWARGLHEAFPLRQHQRKKGFFFVKNREFYFVLVFCPFCCLSVLFFFIELSYCVDVFKLKRTKRCRESDYYIYPRSSAVRVRSVPRDQRKRHQLKCIAKTKRIAFQDSQKINWIENWFCWGPCWLMLHFSFFLSLVEYEGRMCDPKFHLSNIYCWRSFELLM